MTTVIRTLIEAFVAIVNPMTVVERHGSAIAFVGMRIAQVGVALVLLEMLAVYLRRQLERISRAFTEFHTPGDIL